MVNGGCAASILFSKITFESFAKLKELRDEDRRFNPGVILSYEGSSVCGTVGICFGHLIKHDEEAKTEFLVLAAKTLCELN